MIFDASSIYALIRSRRLAPLADGITLDLAIYELGNTLWKGVRRGILTEEGATRLMEIIQRIVNNLRIMRFDELKLEEAIKLATQTQLTFYDASYLYIAIKLDETLVTEDAKLREMAERTGVTVHSTSEL